MRGFKNQNTNNSKIQIQIKNQNKKNSKSKNPKFHSYFAVFFEGAGHIWLPNVNGNKKHNPRFCITFSLKKEPLATKILDIIEYGHIRYKPT